MAVTIYEALEIIEKNIPAGSTHIIPIENSSFYICAKDMDARLNLPPFDNSAMDGFALRGERRSYKIVGKILAGDKSDINLKEGECIKILTGAKIPENTQTIIPQENVKIDKNAVIIQKKVDFGSNIRLAGEDVTKGEIILKKGELLEASKIALLASQGITHIEVYKKPKIAIFASGSELKLHFQKLSNTSIYNSNTPYLLSRCKELNTDAEFIGQSEDSIASLKKLIENSLDYDLIVTSGGVSVGEADYTKEAFKELGMEIFFQKVEIKPGKPTTFGKIGKTLILNLPGNPLACALNFEIFGKFIVDLLKNKEACYPNYIETTITEDLYSKRAVFNVIAGYFDGDCFTPAKKRSPGMVNVLNKCNGFIIIDKKRDILKKKDPVKFLPLFGDFTTKSLKEFTT